MDYTSIYKKVEAYVTDLFERMANPNLTYHNLQHTIKVVARTKEISAHYHLIENDLLVLFVAAWFHDTGYLFDEVALHEEKSVQVMSDFNQTLINDNDIIKSIEEVILATKPSAKPANLLQQILVDADSYHFGTKEIDITNKQVHDEFTARNGPISKKDWDRQTVKMLENHRYYTTYCRELLNDRKKKNIKKLKKNIEQEPDEAATLLGDRQSVKAANNLTTKGIQTMLRLTSENHMKLSDMADGKANILISVNAIIISVILSVLMRRLQEDTYLTVPTIIFLSSSVCTIVVAILATRPKVSAGRFSEQDIDTKKTNLLFFGNFYKCTQEEYEKAMSKMMVDSEYLYGSLIKDIYQLGVVLARKYRLIRWAYNIFMFGIIISVIAFAIAVMMSSSGSSITLPQGSPL
ncbi:Pycsar system effector family protein [Segetibacter sp.]|jgi:HD superfamily phosphodiesterase|uniref:Pycsar system effector family protein n=1 Tax=Segetibacter sp. TaxID=2231182 RepID=UPI002619A9EC|nr:Pycsar system effector family protein [Segetibacter sp.]MCW3082048.1 metal-dependent phosphohydrolase sub domain protein [Segetibacter sp.]